MKTDKTTFENFAEKKLHKIFKDGSPIVIPINDLEKDSTQTVLKNIMETSKVATLIKNKDE